MEGREENIMNNTQIDDEDSNARQGSGKTEREVDRDTRVGV